MATEQPELRSLSDELSAILGQANASYSGGLTSIMDGLQGYSQANQQANTATANWLGNSPYQGWADGALAYGSNTASLLGDYSNLLAGQGNYVNAFADQLSGYQSKLVGIGDTMNALGQQYSGRLTDQGNLLNSIGLTYADLVQGVGDRVGSYQGTFDDLGRRALEQSAQERDQAALAQRASTGAYQLSDIERLLQGSAIDQLQLGGSLSGEEERMAQQSARAANAARGLAVGVPSATAEILNRSTLSDARRSGREQFATGVDQLLETSTNNRVQLASGLNTTADAMRMARFSGAGSLFGAGADAAAQAGALYGNAGNIRLQGSQAATGAFQAASNAGLTGAQGALSAYGSAADTVYNAGQLANAAGGLYGQAANTVSAAGDLNQWLGQYALSADPRRTALSSNQGQQSLSNLMGQYSSMYGSNMNYGSDLYNTNNNALWSLFNTEQNNAAAMEAAEAQASASAAAGNSAMTGSLIGAGGAAAGSIAAAAVPAVIAF